MNDNDIVKALECLGGDEVLCRECAYGHIPYPVCKKLAAKNALDLINRQKAEIDKLRQKLDYENYECERCACDLLDQRDRAKSEAIKEFAERLKDIDDYVSPLDIDNLVKEMTEETP